MEGPDPEVDLAEDELVDDDDTLPVDDSPEATAEAGLTTEPVDLEP